MRCYGYLRITMKKKLLTLLLSSIAVAFICNCSDEVITGSDPKTAYVVNEESFLFNDGDNDYIIATNGLVTNPNGDTVGAADISSGLIVAMDGSIIAQNVDFYSLDIIFPTKITSTAWVLAADQNYVIYTDATVTDAKGNPIGLIIYGATTPMVGDIIAYDGTTLFKDVDVSTLKVYEANVIIPASSASINPNLSSAAPVLSSGSNPNIKSSSSKGTTSSASTPKSSASVKSSSSAAKSSSSNSGSSYQIKYVNGGKSGEGYATRYWDCCKPHCAWPEHGGSASTCDAQGNKIGDKSATSMCDGGNAGICKSQFPIIVNDTLAFAFAATPGGENNCGKCFDLVFQGKGKYNNDRQAKIKGKHLIVMSNNVGYDVAGGQFDVMIPGGGYGIFNGCPNKMGWGSQGSQYGGLLDECEKETGYNSNKYQSCLTEKCNKSFSSDAAAKEGCLFLATWMNAAGNPMLNYREVECPKELTDRY